MVLSDLRHDQWTVVAVRMNVGDEHDVWQWFLDTDHRDALYAAREDGRVLTTQQRGGDGRFRLLARLTRPRPLRVVATVPTNGVGTSDAQS
jgi:hypothetical protein